VRARVKREVCGGSGLCAELCPAVFAQDPNYIAYVLEDGERVDGVEGAAVPTGEQDAAKEAVEACPTEAIVADEADSQSTRRDGERG
jgi:ferredoxin